MRVPPRALGPVDDADFRWVTDVGVTGPDKGAGGAYLFVHPGYAGALPATGFHVDRPRTNRLVIFYRVFVEKGDLAAATANVRSNAFASRDPRTRLFKDRQWLTPFVGGSYQFLSGSERLLDARAMFFYLATGITPAMSEARPGTASAYALTFRDRAGAYLDGGRTYKVTLPGPIPAKDFWAFSVYDNQTRSLLPTDQKSAGIDSTATGLKRNADGGATIWFEPKAPAGKAANWVQTMPGRGYNLILRLYGPLQPWFNQTWQPGDLEPQT